MRISDWSSDVCSSDLNARRRGIWASGGGARMRMVHAETRRRGENIETLKPFALSLSKGRSFLQRGRMKNSASTSSAQTVLGYSLRVSASPREQIFDRSEEHTSELQSLMRISYAVFCLKKKKTKIITNRQTPEFIREHT